ncbi:hypothetical protein [Streptosporangium sp. NPDC000396]|uniref:hypothetical protein n=1 Tax=Streptosporangium sp. NPDC000396 TaxID=3366185 RepID=UPI00367680AE
MRRVVSSVLIVLGCVFAPLALVGFWAADEVADAEQYVENMAPLARNPAIRDAIADRVSGAIIRPMPKRSISPINDLIRKEVDAVVDGNDFPVAWANVNRRAHRQLCALLSCAGGRRPLVWNRPVSFDLTPVYDLVRRGMEPSRLPDLHPTIELPSSQALVKAQTVLSWLTALRWVLPVLSMSLFAAGVFLAPDREIALIGAGLGLAASMVVLAVVLVVVRIAYLPGLTGEGLSADAANAMFDALSRFLKIGLRVLFAAGLTLAATIFIVRRSRTSPARLLGTETAP